MFLYSIIWLFNLIDNRNYKLHFGLKNSLTHFLCFLLHPYCFWLVSLLLIWVSFLCFVPLSYKVQDEVRQLLCMVTRDNPESTEALCSLIMDRISVTMRGHGSIDLSYSVRPEIALLAALMQKEDSCWELKLRSVV